MLVSAAKIHNGIKWLPEGTVIDVADDGTIKAVLNDVTDNVQYYDGVICPGFVNAHCHLELSHLKGAVPEHTGLVPFVTQIVHKRDNYTEEQKVEARHTAFKQMQDNGIVAVGDIANTSDTLDLRVQNKMHFHSFVETYGFTPTPQKQFDYSMAVYHSFTAQEQEERTLRQSVVPHAPYSVSKQLFELVDTFEESTLLSIHNQETQGENEYYEDKAGSIVELKKTFNLDDSFFTPSGKSSLQTYLPWISSNHPVIFVHNTFTSFIDIEFAQDHLPNVYWCLCPNANLYIENTLPNIPMMMDNCDTICIGTDSLSSNHQLSVLAELQAIKKHYADIDWESLLRWATFNGAKALQMDGIIGSIELGKKCGLVHISSLDENAVIEVIA